MDRLNIGQSTLSKQILKLERDVRKVKKGEKGIRILAPIVGVRGKKQDEAEKDITRRNIAVLVGFRTAYVFDVSQTEGA